MDHHRARNKIMVKASFSRDPSLVAVGFQPGSGAKRGSGAMKGNWGDTAITGLTLCIC
jgi:hypothetical protein